MAAACGRKLVETLDSGLRAGEVLFFAPGGVKALLVPFDHGG